MSHKTRPQVAFAFGYYCAMRLTFARPVSVGFGLVALACGGTFSAGGPSPDGGSSGGDGSGGQHSSTGGAGTGAKGGSTSGTGGKRGSGGSVGTGGHVGTGGVVGGTGGSGNGGVPGTGGAGGVIGSGGITASGGVASSGGTPSSGGAGGGTCPATQPLKDDPCGPDSLQCSYGTCCPTIAMCQSGKWNIVYPPCNSPVCPTSPPLDGSACPCGLEGQTCDMNLCTSGGTHTVSKCSGGVWSNQTFGCTPDPCIAVACSNGQICMASTLTGATTCVQNSCGSSNPADACTCIGTACSAQGGICSDLPSGGALCTVPIP
jgi:hypothetical protein